MSGATVAVDLGERSYQVQVGQHLLDSLAKKLDPLGLGSRCVVISDETVAKLYGKAVIEKLERGNFRPQLLTVPSGEKSKSLAVAEGLLEKMADAGCDRKSFVIALGGGVIGDLAGFVAAIYNRGIPYIQLPTTVLAQVDSSVGGKTGVNLASGKNLVGSFHQPLAVFADISTLDTLPDREFNEGFAEVIKHAIIRDACMFRQLENFDRAELQSIIQRNVEIKARIVSDDEFETKGVRALLNFGHTIGHGIENAAGYGVLLHGEAISLGILAAARLSVEKSGMMEAELASIEALLAKFHLPTHLPANITTESVLAAMVKDKKFSQGQIRFVLSPKIGQAYVADDVTLQDVTRQIEALR